MPLIELPRALEDYFAFAETEPTRRGRRFSITLPFHNGEKLERLQWWYHVSPAEEQMFDGHGMLVLRMRGTQRFCRHVGRWLEINRLRLHGNEPIPRLSSQQSAPTVKVAGPGQHSAPRHTQDAARAIATTSSDADCAVTVTALPDWPLIKAVNS